MYNNSSFDGSITLTPIKNEPGDARESSSPTYATLTNHLPTNDNRRASVHSSIISANAPNSTGTSPKQKSANSKIPKSANVRKTPPNLYTFWPGILADVRSIQSVDAKHQALPLARIKKIMKLDEDAKMIAAEAPLLFAKACEYFIQELTMRAWIHTEESRRRTLQRSDIAQAIANYDQFDFLIDIVPREEIRPAPTTGNKKDTPHHGNSNAGANASAESTATSSGLMGVSNSQSTAASQMETNAPEATTMTTFANVNASNLQHVQQQQHQQQQQRLMFMFTTIHG